MLNLLALAWAKRLWMRDAHERTALVYPRSYCWRWANRLWMRDAHER